MKLTKACNAIITSVQPDTILWSYDEAHFHLSVTVNKQIFRYWVTENLRGPHQKPLYRSKVIALKLLGTLCAITLC